MSGAAAGAFVGIAIGHNIARLQQGLAAAPEAWRPLEARGLQVVFEEETAAALRGAGANVRPMLTGTVDGVACGVRVRSDVVHASHTEVSCTLAAPVDGKVGVYPSPAGVLSAIRDWLRQDIEIGDPEFDASFLVTAKPATVAAPLLPFELRERLFALTGANHLVAFTVEDGRALVMLNGVVTDPAVISTAIDVVLEASRASAAR